MFHFTLVSNSIKDENLVKAKEIADRIKKHSDKITVDIIEMQQCSRYAFDNTECILVVGGDGTLLRVAQDTAEKDIPIIGINIGHLGFLAEVDLVNLDDAMERLINEQYHIEERMMLDGFNDKLRISSLNDVVLSRRMDLQIVGYRVSVNGQHLKDYFADGIIISTPTGSTGYNMSAGGSIVEPNAKLIVLTPVCPHTLNTRSIILSAEDVIEVEILPSSGDKPVDVGAYFDGRNDMLLGSGDKITVTKSKNITKIAKIGHIGFLELLQKKMSDR